MFFPQNLVPWTPFTCWTEDKFSFYISFWVFYRCAIIMCNKISVISILSWGQENNVFFNKVKHLQHFFAVSKWFTRIRGVMICNQVSEFYYHGGRWGTKTKNLTGFLCPPPPKKKGSRTPLTLNAVAMSFLEI